MEEINYKQGELEKLGIFDKGGFEAKILIYNDELLIKAFEPYLKGIIDFDFKKMKLIRLHDKLIDDNIMVKPLKLVNYNDEFAGYIMKKETNAITLDNIHDFNKLVKIYKNLFLNLEKLHNNDIIVGDLKHSNILIKDNDKPIFIDVDSMGVDEYVADHNDYRSITTRSIPNFEEKAKYNNQKELDKLKLISCFLSSINKNEKTITQRLFKSDLSDNFKREIYKILKTDKNLNISNNIHELFYEEEKNINKRR